MYIYIHLSYMYILSCKWLVRISSWISVCLTVPGSGCYWLDRVPCRYGERGIRYRRLRSMCDNFAVRLSGHICGSTRISLLDRNGRLLNRLISRRERGSVSNWLCSFSERRLLAAAGHTSNREHHNVCASIWGEERPDHSGAGLAGQQYGRIAAEVRVLRQEQRPRLCPSAPIDTAQLLHRSGSEAGASVCRGLHREAAESLRKRQATLHYCLLGARGLWGNYRSLFPI